MPFVREIVTLVSAPQWLFVYQLVVLVSVEAAVAIAYGQWRRGRQREASRLARGMAALLALRLVPLLVATWGRPATAGDLPFFPPLERALDVIALAIIVWLVVSADEASKGLASPLLVVNLGLAPLVYAGFTWLWLRDLAADPTLVYGATWQRYAWANWQILLCLAGVYAVLRRRAADNRAALWLTLFALTLAGQAAEMAAPFSQAHVAVWTHLAHLISYPFLVVIVYKEAMEDADRSRPDLAGLPAGSALSHRLLELFRNASSAPGLADLSAETQDALALRAVRFMAGALGVDQAAIGLLEGAKQERMRLVGIFNARGQGRSGEVVSFPLKEQRSIRRALHRQEAVQVGAADDALAVRFLYSLMGSSDVGPLLIQPLAYRGQTVGVFLAGNDASSQPLPEVTLQLAHTLAAVVARLLVAPRVVGRLERELQERGRLLSARETEWGQRLETLDRELQQERDSAHLFAQRLADLEREQTRKEAELGRLSRRLLLQEEALQRSQQEAAALGRKTESLALDRARLEDEAGGYREQIQGLEQLLKQGQVTPSGRKPPGAGA